VLELGRPRKAREAEGNVLSGRYAGKLSNGPLARWTLEARRHCRVYGGARGYTLSEIAATRMSHTSLRRRATVMFDCKNLPTGVNDIRA